MVPGLWSQLGPAGPAGPCLPTVAPLSKQGGQCLRTWVSYHPKLGPFWIADGVK